MTAKRGTLSTAGLVLEVASKFDRRRVDTALAVYVREPALWTIEALAAGVEWVGRLEGPTFISDLDALVGGLPDDQLRPILGWLYNRSGYPLLCLPEARWFDLFMRVGYTVDGEPAKHPSWPMQLWRGALPDHRANWSWTSTRDFAWWYANDLAPVYSQGTGQGKVWTAYVPPWRLLAAVTESYRPDGSSDGDLQPCWEYIVYTKNLAITEDPIQGRVQ